MRRDSAGHIAKAYGLTAPDRDRLRRLFGEPQPFYSVSDAAYLSGTTAQEVEACIAETEIILEGGLLPWEDVAYLVYGRMPPLLVEAALGPLASTALPSLVRSVQVTLRLPRWQLVFLDGIALRESFGRYDWSMSDAVSLVISDGTNLESAGDLWHLADFHAAYRFPSRHIAAATRTDYDGG